jgi:ribonuclease E
VRVATDVAIYTLNQKRHELARLEKEYDITISFDPKEDLKAGDFDIERIGQRDPESRPKPLPPVEDAPPVTEEEIEPEIVEDSEPVRTEDTIHEEIPAESHHHHLQQGEEGSGHRRRRRRRRGGRDRDHPAQSDRRPEPGPSPPQVTVQVSAEEPHNEDAGGNIVEADTPSLQAPKNGEGQQNAQQGQLGEGHRRKRRRRRGRRGGRDRENLGGRADNGAPGVGEAAIESRFGRPDEIDTTPREEPRSPTEVQPSQIRRPEAVPNAASTPVWSLKAERAETPPKPPEEKVSVLAEAPRETPSAPQPAKKGWWQRAFRTD